MKKYNNFKILTILLKLIIINSIIVFQLNASTDFNFTPFSTDFKGVEAKGDTTAAYGSNGVIFISFDDAETWNEIQAFASENIVNIFIENDRLVAFSHSGKVAASNDGGNTWNYPTEIDDSLVFVVKGGDNYFARAQNSLIKLDIDLNVSGNTSLSFKSLSYDAKGSFLFRNELSFLNDRVYVAASSNVIKFDDSLLPVDTLSLNEMDNCDSCIVTELYNDTEYIYFRASSNLYKIFDLDSVEKILNISKKNYELFDSVSFYIHHFDIINSKKYSLNQLHKVGESDVKGPYFKIYEILDSNNAIFIGEINCSMFAEGKKLPRVLFNDFTIENDRLTIVRDEKYINTFSFNDLNTKTISNLQDINIYSDKLPLANDNDELLYFTENQMFKSIDGGKTFQDLDSDSLIFNDGKNNIERILFHQKEDADILYIINSDSKVLISEDFGMNFSSKQLDSLDINIANSNASNLNKYGNGFVLAAYNTFPYQGKNYVYNRFHFYDKDFNLIEYRKDSNYTVDYIKANSTNEYLIISRDTNNLFSNSSIKYTTNNGEDWQVIKEYGSTPDTIWFNSNDFQVIYDRNLISYDEVKVLGKSYLILNSYRKSDSIYTIDILGLENRELDSVFKRKITEFRNPAVESYKDTVYIAYGDTLFYFHAEHLYNSEKWNHYLFPNNGKIWGRKLKRNGNRLLALYEDDKRQTNLYWFKLPDDITSVEENKTEIKPYIYADKPYPIPAGNSVTAEIYWGRNFEMEKADIGIYDIKGNKVEDDENININSQSNWPGRLTWDCRQVSDGIYFIVIEYWQSSKSIPIIKNSSR